MINTSQCDPDDVPICVNCIGDDFLRDEIRTSGCTASCSVCGAEAISWGSRQYAQRIFQFSNLALHLQASDFFLAISEDLDYIAGSPCYLME